MKNTSRWTMVRPVATMAFAAACTLLGASTTLVVPPDALAATAPAAQAAPAPARSRFVVPQDRGERLPHASAESFRSATYLPPAPPAKRAGKGVAKDAAVDAFVPPGPADLGENDDVVLTPAIRSLADSLGHNPVQIYNWVRDHVAFTPTWGSIQGADATLQTRRGNAYDTASLLVALLRASNVPARYAYGTIEVPAAAAQNWVGGVAAPEAAVSLFDQGGVPVQGVVSGGSIGALRLEHVWVEAWVDFNPSRGAVNRSASTWVPLDASYKQYRYSAGLPVRTGVTLDTAALSARIAQGASISADGVSGLDLSTLAAAYADFTGRVDAYIQSHKPGATVADVLGAQSIIGEGLPVLAGALPYKTVALGAVYSDLPDTLRWKVQYGVYADEFERSQGHALASVSQSLPKWVGKRLTLTFPGASAGDDSRLAARLNANPLPANVSASTVSTKVQLTIDGTVAASGGSVPFGTALVGAVGIFDPQVGDWRYAPGTRVVAGETHSLALIGNGVSPATLAASRDRLAAMGSQLAAHQYAGLGQDGLVGEVLDYAALAYATTVAGNTELMCKACGIVGYPLPTIVRVSTHATVTSANGLPQSVAFPGVALTVEAIGRTAVASDANAARAQAFQRTYGERASAYTHLLLDALFTDAAHAGSAASAVRALHAATTSGQKIYRATSTNGATVLPQLGVDPATITVMQDAIQSGRTATISQSGVAVGAWNGVGYVLEDTATGSGDYEISGREQAELDVAGGWLPLALAGPALGVQGDAVAAALQGPLTVEANYYNAAVALLADYGTVPWSNFVGAPTVLSQWWLCALWDGLPGALGDIGTSVVSAVDTVDHTGLPGGPQTNNAPYFTSAPVTSGALGQAYQYFATATDPDGDALTFQLVGAPNGVTLSSAGLLAWASPVTGSYPITLRVSDGHATAEQAFTLTIGQVMPLDLNLAVAPQFVNEGDTVTITVATTGGSGTVAKSLAIDGTNVPLDANGQAHVAAHGAGTHTVVANATDNKGTLVRSSAFGVHVDGDTTPPTVQITAPADGDVLTKPTPVSGVVSDANTTLWTLSVSPTGRNAWRELARGSGAVNGALGAFDPTQVENGQYDLGLVAWDANGSSASAVQHVVVQGDLKIGAFTVSFNDIQLDVGGVPLTITRTYDSRRKDEKGDFGYGWTLSYQNVKLQRNKPLGEQWELYQPGFLTFCIRPIGKRVVSIALSDGKVHQFDVVASQECATGGVPAVFSMAFNPRPGTTSTLDVLDGGDLLYQGGTVFDPDEGAAYDSQSYQLTTIENFKYILKSSDGANTFKVVQITDPNGQTLVLNAQGAFAGNGAALQFTRDAEGRITQVTDPSGRKVKYAYTAAGDLDSITSPANKVSRNQYATVPAALAHLLTNYTDASGVQQVRNEYDASGRLVAQYDALGNKIDLSQRDLDTHTQAVTDRNGNTKTYTFDDQGNITKVVDALGGVTTSTFDAFGNLLATTDPLGRSTSTTYDTPSGTVLTQTDGLGHTTTTDWNFYTMMGNHTPQSVESVTDALGHATTFGYTDPGMLRSITDALGHSTGLGWGGSSFDQLVQFTDPTGYATTYQNDAQGRKTQETDPLGNVTKYTYDADGNRLTTVRTRVVAGQTQTLTTTYVYDADGNLTTETDPLGNITRYAWTAQKQLASLTDPLGRMTRYAYDVLGRESLVTYPDGTSTATERDPNGNVIKETDRAGRETRTEYDALDRAVAVVNPDGSRATTAYDAGDQETASSDELGRTTHSAYDAAGRKTQSTDPAGNATDYEYNAVGKLTKVTDALGHAVQHDYDAANRRTRTTWADGSASQYAYDAAGRKTGNTDALGRTTTLGYDRNGRMNKVTDALGKITAYGYDELGNKTSQTDALNHATQWGYDALGRATSITLPDARYQTMAYDAAGRLTNSTDFAGNASGYQYDAAGRIRSRTFVDGTVLSTTYTQGGQVASLTRALNGASTVTRYGYDSRDRLVDVTNADQSKLHYEYDAAGQRTAIVATTPDGQGFRTDYAYDAAGNLASVTAFGQTVTFRYDAANRRIERDDPNGVVTTYAYDANDRLTAYETKHGASVLVQGGYTLNAAGQRTALSQHAPDGSVRDIGWSYDGAARLTGETRSLPAHAATWTLDAVGNRSAQTLDGANTGYTYDSADRLTAATGSGAATYAWDANGQIASRTQGGATTTYTFNAEHNLAGVALPGGVGLTYAYAPDGNLSQRTKSAGGSSQTTAFLVDANNDAARIVAEYDAAGHATAVYVYGDELILRFRGGQGTYYHHDGLGSIVALSDASGAAIQFYGYDAWGNRVESTGSDDNAFGFAGERFDADTGLLYLRARWYDPGIARFTAPDAYRGCLGCVASLNRYLYAGNDPVNNADPSGNMTLAETSAAEDIQADLNLAGQQAGRQFAQGAGRSVFNRLGELAEKGVKKIIEQCVGPGKAKGAALKGTKINLDFEVQLAGKLRTIESKYQIPKAGSEAMMRLVNQIKAAAAEGREVLIVSGKKLGPGAKANREKLLRELSGVDAVSVIGGFVDFAMFIEETAGGCL
ncbi:RHS repeat-associated protein [Dokdonella fugitiva]|uniref:RHS repeat-associated protein n=1 Tax=Dokdonella fugitiva TaxID=328517 RepID=A0A839F807_9GAMM|nr:RHS repeat-associated core domain-containing protein [Dokdonella fugitiva]MBA8888344.1 RHS repeat-associated protein [Dokdonella fugitiva]